METLTPLTPQQLIKLTKNKLVIRISAGFLAKMEWVHFYIYTMDPRSEELYLLRYEVNYPLSIYSEKEFLHFIKQDIVSISTEIEKWENSKSFWMSYSDFVAVDVGSENTLEPTNPFLIMAYMQLQQAMIEEYRNTRPEKRGIVGITIERFGGFIDKHRKELRKALTAISVLN